MKLFNRSMALMIALAVLICALASCDMGGETGSGESGYRADTRITYATNDPAMENAVAAMQGLNATLYVAGDKIMATAEADFPSGKLNESYILIGDAIYHTNSLTLNEVTKETKSIVFFDENDRDSLKNQIGYGMNITTEDFDNVEIEDFGESKYYSCTGIKAESKESLSKIFSSALLSSESCSLADVQYTQGVVGDRITESVLSCHFVITIGDNSYEVTAHIDRQYTYLDEIAIVAPQDVENYNYIHYSELFR